MDIDEAKTLLRVFGNEDTELADRLLEPYTFNEVKNGSEDKIAKALDNLSSSIDRAASDIAATLNNVSTSLDGIATEMYFRSGRGR